MFTVSSKNRQRKLGASTDTFEPVESFYGSGISEGGVF